MARIKAVQQGTNAALIATAQALYPMTGLVLDLTPGDEEGFWSTFQPANLVMLQRGNDFRTTGLTATYGHCNHVVFDPPYVTKGGHKTSTIESMNKRYGMLHVEKNPMAQWDLQILPGLAEAHRLLVDDGLLWLKCMDYVTSGRVWWFTKMALRALEEMGFELVDEFILDGSPGPQPLTDKCRECKGAGHLGPATGAAQADYGRQCLTCEGAGTVPRRQVHAARAHSVLIIARKRTPRQQRAWERREANLRDLDE